MKLGIDLSFQKELDALNIKCKYKGKEIEPFSFFHKHNDISMIRLRLWVDPFDKDNHPYGGGTNDLKTFIELAKRANAQGMSILLDFHYSDFWVDPSRQLLPKKWQGLSYQEICEEIYQYTKDTLQIIKDNNIDLGAIQVGNEISHGILFPYGEIIKEYDPKNGGGFQGLTTLLKQGLKACKEIYPNAKRVLHLEHSGSLDMQDWFFSNMAKYDVDFEVIGESYYPYWHGPFNMFENCLKTLKKKYQKEIWVVELGYESAPYEEGHDFSEVRDAKEGDFISGNINGRIPFPQTKEGQKDYIAHMLKICKNIGVSYIFYWEPTWYPKDIPWASDAGQIYCGLTPTFSINSYSISTFFDEKGEANPVIDIYTQDFVDNL